MGFEIYEEKYGPESSIPSQGEWGNYDLDMETKFSYLKFGGKSVYEALPFIEENPSEAYGYIWNMTDIPFRYYIYGFEIAVMSGKMKLPENTNAGLVASCFLGLIEDALKRTPNRILPIMHHLIPVAEYVADNQEKFGASEQIFGSFKKVLDHVKRLYSKEIERKTKEV